MRVCVGVDWLRSSNHAVDVDLSRRCYQKQLIEALLGETGREFSVEWVLGNRVVLEPRSVEADFAHLERTVRDTAWVVRDLGAWAVLG